MESDVEHPTVEEADSPSKRRFLAYAAGALMTITSAGIIAPLAGMFLAPLFGRRKELWLTLGKLDEVPAEQPTKFVYRYVRMDGWLEKTIYGTAYIVRKGPEITAFSNICTHLGCGVRWDPDKKEFRCPCHNGVFDITGKVVSGPPPKPLTQFTSRIQGGKIEIRVEEA